MGQKRFFLCRLSSKSALFGFKRFTFGDHASSLQSWLQARLRNELDLAQVPSLWLNKPVEFECSKQGSLSRSILFPWLQFIFPPRLTKKLQHAPTTDRHMCMLAAHSYLYICMLGWSSSMHIFMHPNSTKFQKMLQRISPQTSLVVIAQSP